MMMTSRVSVTINPINPPSRKLPDQHKLLPEQMGTLSPTITKITFPRGNVKTIRMAFEKTFGTNIPSSQLQEQEEGVTVIIRTPDDVGIRYRHRTDAFIIAADHWPP